MTVNPPTHIVSLERVPIGHFLKCAQIKKAAGDCGFVTNDFGLRSTGLFRLELLAQVFKG
ncbi:hypothetical protein GCM10011273_20760 [Asticcacaulis endophyticus]|uniref:Uncharacterized protein n=1 Tax=Asticcacaulis endophyticus TaxID=1395890 RepID=A0A918UTM5_9CAUL|nr:hypothetical protein GCM10011273_20760 [Asticcacaulis endophyticus]